MRLPAFERTLLASESRFRSSNRGTEIGRKKDEFAKDGDKVAQMMKGKVVAACPTTSVVGTCNAGMGMLVNYSGPKWTADTAKKDCLAHPYQKWVD